MKPSNDIADLLGRYATGSLTAGERQRLFDAALNDQDLFEELAREQELKMLLDQPGARARMIAALEPQRKTAWIVSGSLAAVLTMMVLVMLLRPHPQPKPEPQVAIATAPAPVAISKSLKLPSAAQPILDAPSKDAAKPETVEVQSAVAVSPVQQRAENQVASGGPRQQMTAPQARAFGFHYSLPNKNHLIIVPGADGYLSVKSSSGAILLDRNQIAAGITTDIPIPDGTDSVTVTFSETANPVQRPPTVHEEPGGSIQGTGGLAVEIRVK